MAYVTPKTDYVDDVLNTEVNQLRKYNIVNNADGTISLIDVTNYSQVGTFVGAKELNEIGNDIIDLDDTKLDETGDASDTTVTFTIAETETDIITGEKQSTILGKILKSISTFRTGKINVSQIINNLAATVTGNVLDATQGKALKDYYDALNTSLVKRDGTVTITTANFTSSGSNYKYNLDNSGVLTIRGNTTSAFTTNWQEKQIATISPAPSVAINEFVINSMGYPIMLSISAGGIVSLNSYGTIGNLGLSSLSGEINARIPII